MQSAGRNTAGLCLEGRTYASGLSVSEATFFGLLVTVGVACAVGEYVIRSYGVLQGQPAYVIRSLRQRP